MPYSSHYMCYLCCKLCFCRYMLYVCRYMLWFCYHMWCLCIICSDFSIIPTFCHSIGSVLTLYRIVYALYGVQTILPRVHFALFAVLSSLYRTVVMIYPQCKARLSDPSSSQPDAAILVYFRGKVEERSLLWKPSLSNWGLVPFWKDSAMRDGIFFKLILQNFGRKSVGWSVTNKLLSNSKEARLLQAIIDSFLGADRNFLFLLNFDIISLKCSAVTIGIQCTLFLKNDALTWKDRLHITSAKKRPFAYQIFESWTNNSLDSDCLQ